MTAAPLIYIVDDDESIRGCSGRPATRRAHTDPQASSCLIRCPIVLAACCLTCVCRVHPVDLQAALQRQGVAMPVIFLTGHPNVASCVQAMKAGAIDFLAKPIEPKPFWRRL
jgi:FixJ family two-component response regulator